VMWCRPRARQARSGVVGRVPGRHLRGRRIDTSQTYL
jgi:hypothetical protein